MQVVEEKIRTVDGNLATKKYVVLEKVGQGAFSQCFRVQVLGSEQIFAMKIISKQKMALLEKEKLVEQIRIHQTLSHSSIVFLDHWFEDKSYQYIFLEFCAKKTLEERCKKYDSLDEKYIRRYGLQILSALKYLRSKLVLHRDLKLSNFFLDSNDNIKLGDFGFACRLQGANDRKRQACGTPNFTAPEVINAIGYDCSADLWSFGVILYRMKFGVCPFQMPELRDTLKKIKEVSYVFPKWTSISPELHELIEKIFKLDPEERPTLEEIQAHPFFTKANDTSKGQGGIRGLVNRMFSTDKNDDRQRKDSCESKKQIKNIFRQKTGDTPVGASSNRQVNTVLSKTSSTSKLELTGCKTDRPKSPKRSQSSNKERLLNLLKKNKSDQQQQKKQRSVRKQSPPSRGNTLRLVDPTKIQQHMAEQKKSIQPARPALLNSARDHHQTAPLEVRNHIQPQPLAIERQSATTTTVNGIDIIQQKTVLPASLFNAPAVVVGSTVLPSVGQHLSWKNEHSALTNGAVSEATSNKANSSATVGGTTRKMTSSEALLARLHAAKKKQTTLQQPYQTSAIAQKDFNITFKADDPPQLEGLSVVSAVSRSEDLGSKRPQQTFGNESSREQPKAARMYRTEVVAKIEDKSTASQDEPNRFSQNPLQRMQRLKNKAKTQQSPKQPPSNSITNFYPFFLVCDVQVVNEHCILSLTNGVRQIIKGKDIYSVFSAGRIFDCDGLELQQPSKMLDYISRQKLPEPYVPLTETHFKALVQKKQLISRWRVSQGKMMFALLSATAITTSKSGLFYLRTSQFEYLYSRRLQIVQDAEQVSSCRGAYEQMQRSLAQRQPGSKSTSRSKKMLQ